MTELERLDKCTDMINVLAKDLHDVIWAIEQYDKLHDGAFLAFSWGIDEVTDYHVIVERSYLDHRVYGTTVEWYK